MHQHTQNTLELSTTAMFVELEAKRYSDDGRQHPGTPPEYT